jgi:hypothetical protein
MDSPRRPLSLWEKVYWRLFVVFGGVGLVYETYVLENRGLFPSAQQRLRGRAIEAEADSVRASMWASAGGEPFASGVGFIDGQDACCAVISDGAPVIVSNNVVQQSAGYISSEEPGRGRPNSRLKP